MWTFIKFFIVALVLIVSHLNAQLSIEYSDANKGKVSKENPSKAGKFPKLTDPKKECEKKHWKLKDGKLSGQGSHALSLSFQGLTASQLTTFIKDDLSKVLATILSLEYCMLGNPTVTTIGSTVIITFTLTLSSVAFASLLGIQIEKAEVLTALRAQVSDPAFFDGVSITSLSVDSTPLTETDSPSTAPTIDQTANPVIAPTAAASETPTETPTGSPSPAPIDPGCFPQYATVVLADSKGVVKMADLQYGDRVKVVNRRGEVSFQEVIFMAHRIFDVRRPYVHLKTSRHELRLSDEHFARVCTKGCDSGDGVLTDGRHEFHYVMAKAVKIGDKLLVLNDGTGNQLYHETVIDTWMTLEEGVFAPIVDCADLVVDGVVVSPYAGWIVSHSFPRLTPYEPYVIDVITYLFHLMYNAIGPTNMERVFIVMDFHDFKPTGLGRLTDSTTFVLFFLIKTLIIIGGPLSIVYYLCWVLRTVLFQRSIIKSKEN